MGKAAISRPAALQTRRRRRRKPPDRTRCPNETGHGVEVETRKRRWRVNRGWVSTVDESNSL